MKKEQRSTGTGWLARLGLWGFASIEAPLLAALATEQPLLLIGPHGTAKSLLLTRVAAALGLSFRHYNASLLSFDDLVGFPVPGAQGCLEYLKTPAAIWGAGAVIFDEISRCRPDLQNKLFPIIHERKVQGLPLVGLRYRWAAMNPPLAEGADSGYLGSEPLDRALADRFAFVLQMPAWSEFSRDEQLAVIQADEQAEDPAAGIFLQQLLQRTSALLTVLRSEAGGSIAAYVHTLLPLLQQAGIELSPRRANLLHQAVLAVHASCLALNPDTTIADSALLALRCALPQRAEGIELPEVKLLAAHREAIRAVDLRPDDPLRLILCTPDPLERLSLAIRSTRLPKREFSNIAADCLAQLPPGAREAAIVHLFETGAVGRLNAAIASQSGEVYQGIVRTPNFSESVHVSNPRYRCWSRLKDLLSQLNPKNPRAHLQANAMASLFARRQVQTPEDVERAFDAFVLADAKAGRP
jgi:MoxR-like ATPase